MESRVLLKNQQSVLRQAARNLMDVGYTVIPDVVDETRAQACIDDIWKVLEATSMGSVRRTDPHTHQGKHFFPVKKGIIEEPCAISHAWGVWETRKLAAEYFAWLYGDTHLATSMDRINVYPAPSATLPPKKAGSWMHTDQTPLRNGRCCIQGFVDFHGTGPLDGGLLVAEKSHLFHHELLYKQWEVAVSGDWYKLTDEQRALVDKKFKVVKVLCPPRSLVLWDSRLFHQNVPPLMGGHERLVVYVCMLPWAFLPDKKRVEIKARKVKAFLEMRTTRHCPLKNTLFGLHAQTYGKPLPVFDLRPEVIGQPKLEEDAVICGLVGRSEQPVIDRNFGGSILLMETSHLYPLNKTALLRLLSNKSKTRPDEGNIKEAFAHHAKKAKKVHTIS